MVFTRQLTQPQQIRFSNIHMHLRRKPLPVCYRRWRSIRSQRLARFDAFRQRSESMTCINSAEHSVFAGRSNCLVDAKNKKAAGTMPTAVHCSDVTLNPWSELEVVEEESASAETVEWPSMASGYRSPDTGLLSLNSVCKYHKEQPAD
jgi:hypothetical protein